MIQFHRIRNIFFIEFRSDGQSRETGENKPRRLGRREKNNDKIFKKVGVKRVGRNMKIGRPTY